jgi:hypothetical protein
MFCRICRLLSSKSVELIEQPPDLSGLCLNDADEFRVLCLEIID